MGAAAGRRAGKSAPVARGRTCRVGGTRTGARPAGRLILIKACLNGTRGRNEHDAVPLTPQELAADAAAAVKAGAAALHVHPRGADGMETLGAAACAAAVMAIRERCPGTPVGLSTGAWMAPEPGARVRLLESWTVLPDFVSVNFSERGTAEVWATLIRRGIGIEAGLWSVPDVRALIDSGLAPWCLRVLIETQPQDPAEAVAAAVAMDALLDEAQVWLPRLHHGDGLATWAVLDAALVRGHDIRVGLEDTLQLPDGSRAHHNAALVAEAVQMVRRHGHRPAEGPPA